MLKKVIGCILVLCLVLTFPACSKTSPETEEIAAQIVGQTFKGKVEFDHGRDWDVTWVFGEEVVSVTKNYKTISGEPCSYTDEYTYIISGTYENASVVFPDSHNWNDLTIRFDHNGKITALHHQDTVDWSTFSLVESVSAAG